MPDVQRTRVDESGFEKRGGYASPKIDLTKLPQVPSGPAQGATEQPSPSTDTDR